MNAVIVSSVVNVKSRMASASPSHVCAFPMSDEQLWEMSAAFIADGLAADDHVVYFSDNTAEAVLERLADDGVAVDAPLAGGQLEIVPTETTRAILSGSVEDGCAGLRASIDKALAAGRSGWRMTGEMSHGLRRLGGVGLPEYDRGMAAELAGRPARALCIYDRRRYSDAAVHEMRAVHEHEVGAPAVYDDSLLRITRTGLGGVRLAGHADFSSRGMIDRLLDNVLDDALRSHAAPVALTVDLASLRFLDVAGAIAMVQAADRFPSTHRLVLRGVRPRVQRVLDRCGAPFAHQLDVIARPEPDDHAHRCHSAAAS